MAAHEHLAAGQFHRREGRPGKHEHEADGEGERSNAPRKARVHIVHPGHPRHHPMQHGHG